LKRTYQRPELTLYGRVDQLTLGQHSGSPDYNINSGQVSNDNCNPLATSTTGQSGNSNPFVCLS
jgi:hypothetical protein